MTKRLQASFICGNECLSVNHFGSQNPLKLLMGHLKLKLVLFRWSWHSTVDGKPSLAAQKLIFTQFMSCHTRAQIATTFYLLTKKTQSKAAIFNVENRHEMR